MTLTLSTSPIAATWLHEALPPVRAAAAATTPPARADAVAAALSIRLPPMEILSAEQRDGSPEHYQQHVLHVEPDASFSITALVWRPGQSTPIHDHVCWCTVGVLSGVEHEVRYEKRLRLGQRTLVEVGQRNSFPGDVSGFAPPGDIHLVQNRGMDVAISLHVYGADIGARGTSVRRVYEAHRVSRRAGILPS